MSSTKSSISPLYSRYLTAEEKRALQLVPVDDVSSEINLLRILTAIYLKVQQTAPSDLASRIQALRTFTLMCHQLAILISSVDRAHSPLGEVDDALSEALKNIPFDIPNDEKEPTWPKNAALSPETGTPSNMASIPDISTALNEELFPISRSPT
jgi:hypothetical protein